MDQNQLNPFIRSWLTVCLLIIVSACNNSNNNISETSSVTQIPVSIQKLTTLPSGTLRAWITVDDGARTEMTLNRDAGTASAEIPGLSLTSHDVLIEYEFTDSYGTILLASATTTVDMSSGSTTINFETYDTSHDKDQDGMTNIAEFAAGTNPFGQPAFNTNCFPLNIASSNGNLVVNYDGDLLIANFSDSILLMNHETCNVTPLVQFPGETFRAVVENKTRNRVYAGGNANIHEINPDTGDRSTLVNVGTFINSIVLAPPGFGNYGGQLIVGKSNGDIVAIDQSVENPDTTNVIATVAGANVSNLIFGNDGTLYAADYDLSKIVTVDANGTLTDFTIGILQEPDGLAIDNIGSRLFIASSGTDKLYTADIPSGDLSELADVDFNIDFASSGLAYDDHDRVIMVTASSQIKAHLTTPFNSACFPLAVTGTTTSIASYTSYASGDLLFTSYDTDDIRVLNRKTCTLTTLASNVSGSELLGITYDPSHNMIYVGSTDNNIYAVDPTDGSSSVLTAVVANANGLVIAPTGYGSYGGQLIAALDNGQIFAIDQALPTPTLIGNIPNAIATDLIFDSDGTLYVADFTFGNILIMPSSGGTPVAFATNLSRPDGLAIDNDGRRLLVADSGLNQLIQVPIPGATPVNLTVSDFDIGFTPSGIFFDEFSTVIFGTGGSSQTITSFGL